MSLGSAGSALELPGLADIALTFTHGAPLADFYVAVDEVSAPEFTLRVRAVVTFPRSPGQLLQPARALSASQRVAVRTLDAVLSAVPARIDSMVVVTAYPGFKIRSTSNSSFHTFTFGPFSAVSTPIFASK